MRTVAEAIRSLVPDARFALADGVITRWEGPGEPPTERQIAERALEIEAEREAARTRAAEIKAALDAAGCPRDEIVYEIIMAMNYVQLSGQVDWPSPMDAIINRVLGAALSRAD